MSDQATVGRPRSAEAHEAILRATLELLSEQGLQRLSMEAVRIRAGVGKATIYRRWPSKVELVKEAIGRMRVDVAPDDTGSFRGDYLAFIASIVTNLTAAASPGLMPRLMSEASHDPALLELIHESLDRPRRAAARTVLERGVERGELRPDIDFDLAIDLLSGPIVYRNLLSGGDLSRLAGYPERVVDAVVSGIGAPPPRTRRPRR